MSFKNKFGKYGYQLDIPDPLEEEDELLGPSPEEQQDTNWAESAGRTAADLMLGLKSNPDRLTTFEDTNAVAPQPSVGEYLKGAGVDLLTTPLKAVKGVAGVQQQLAENYPYLSPHSALMGSENLQTAQDYLGRSISDVEAWGKPEAYKLKQEQPFLHDPASLVPKVLGALGDIGLMAAQPELAIPYLATKVGGETYESTKAKLKAQGLSEEEATDKANKAALFAEGSTLLAGKAGEKLAGPLVGVSTSKARGVLGGFAASAAPFAGQAGAQSVMEDVLTSEKIDTKKALNAAAEQLPYGLFGAKGGLGKAKANKEAADLKNIFTQVDDAIKASRTGDAAFDAGLELGKQGDLFGYREPTVKDMFSGEETSAVDKLGNVFESEEVGSTQRALERPVVNDRLKALRDQESPQFVQPQRSQEAQDALDARAVELGRQNMGTNPDLAGANDLLSERSIQNEARLRAQQEGQRDFPELLNPNADRETVRAANEHIQGLTKEHEATVREERIRQVGEALDRSKQRTPAQEQKAEQLTLDLISKDDGFMPGWKEPDQQVLTQTGRTHDFVRAQEKLIGDSVAKELGIKAEPRSKLTKPQEPRKFDRGASYDEYKANALRANLEDELGVPQQKEKPSKLDRKSKKAGTSNNAKAFDAKVAEARSKLDTSSVDMYDAGPTSGKEAHTSPESVVEELKQRNDSTSRTILKLVASGKITLEHSDKMSQEDRAFESQLEGGKKIRGGYNSRTDSVKLFYDRIGKGDVRPLLFHELGEHAGSAELAPHFEAIFRTITGKANGGDALAKDSVQFGKDSADAAGRLGVSAGRWVEKLRKETVAKFMQLAEAKALEENGLGKYSQMLRDVYATSKVWMIRKGLVEAKDLTAEDIRAFSRAAIKGWAENGGKPSNEGTAYDYVPGREKDETKNFGGVKTQLGANARLDAERLTEGRFKWKGSTGQAVLRKIFLNSGYPSAQARQLSEEHQGRRSALIADINAARNRWEDTTDKIPQELKAQALRDGPDVLKAYPEAHYQLIELRKKIGGLAALIADELQKSGNLSAKDRAVMLKILKTGEDYLHSAHMLFVPDSKIKNKYVNTILSAYEKNPNEGEGLRVKNAIEFIVDKDLAFPENLEAAKTPTLRRLYTSWLGESADGVKRSDLINKLKAVQAEVEKGGNDPKQRAMDLVLELLGRRNQNDSNYRKIYTGSRLDRSGLTPLTKLPEPLHELFGRVDKPDFQLFDTLQTQAKIFTGLRYLNNLKEIGVREGWVRRAEQGSGGVTTEKLTGETFGPLQDHWTTPAMKEHLDSYLEVSKNLNAFEKVVVPKWQKLVRTAKTAVTIGNIPGAYAMNLGGAPLQMALNGNISRGFFNEHSLYGLKAAIGMIGISGKKSIPAETREMIDMGLTDSAQIGELRGTEARARLNELLEAAGYSDATVRAKAVKLALGKLLELGKDGYAAMDVWAKFANYSHQKAILKDVYAKEGIQISEKDIQRQAAERTKMTNFSYNRAAPWIKFTERNGITMFGTYFYETWRTTVNNIAMIANDLKWAKEFKNPEAASALRKHALTRMVGQLAVHSVQVGILSGLAGMLGQGGIGASDDNKIRAALPKGAQDKLLLQLGKTSDGKSIVFFDVGRLDPTDPENSTLRHLITGLSDPDKSFGDVAGQIAKDIAGQRFTNSLVGFALDTASTYRKGEHPSQPNFSRSAPELYDWIAQNTNGLNPDMRNTVLGAAEKILPNVIFNVANARHTYKHDSNDAWVAGLQAAGLKPVVFTPSVEVEKEASHFNSKVKSDAALRLKQDVYPGMPKEQLEKRFLEYKQSIDKGVEDLKNKIDGAEAAGMTKSEIRKSLKEANVKQDDIYRLMQGKNPRDHYTEKTFEGIIESKIGQLPVGGSKAEVRRQYRLLTKELNKLARQYRDYNSSEEN